MPVYVIHLERKLGRAQDDSTRALYGHGPRENSYKAHAQHYIGWTPDLARRLRDHLNGNGNASRLLAAAHRRGIDWAVAAIYRPHPGPCQLNARGYCERCVALEHKLHARKSTPRFCPICRGEHDFVAYDPDRHDELIVEAQK